jgi:hypothetical protein
MLAILFKLLCCHANSNPPLQRLCDSGAVINATLVEEPCYFEFVDRYDQVHFNGQHSEPVLAAAIVPGNADSRIGAL